MAIRKGTFETNSSSTHSLSITPEDKEMLLDNSIKVDGDTLVLQGGEFGWGWEKFNDALTKANYCAVDNYEDKKPSELVNKKKNDRLALLEEVLKEQLGVKKIEYNFTSNYPSSEDDADKSLSWAYIDHESVGTSYGAFKDKETLRRFIFDKNCWLFIGNDNSGPPVDFFPIADEDITHYIIVSPVNVDAHILKIPVKVNNDEKKQLNKTIQSIYDHKLVLKAEGRYYITDGYPVTPGDLYGPAKLKVELVFDTTFWLKHYMKDVYPNEIIFFEQSLSHEIENSLIRKGYTLENMIKALKAKTLQLTKQKDAFVRFKVELKEKGDPDLL